MNIIYKIGSFITFGGIAAINYNNLDSSPLYKKYKRDTTLDTVVGATLLFKSGIYATIWPLSVSYILLTILAPPIRIPTDYVVLLIHDDRYKNHFIVSSKYDVHEMMRLNYLQKKLV